MGFTVPSNHRMKIRHSEKIKKYMQKNSKKMFKLWVAMLPFVVGTLVIERRLEELEIRGKIDTIQTTALLVLPRILRRVLET